MESLVSLPPTTETLEDVTENIDGEGLTEVGGKLQREEEKYELYDRMYIGQISD